MRITTASQKKARKLCKVWGDLKLLNGTLLDYHQNGFKVENLLLYLAEIQFNMWVYGNKYPGTKKAQTQLKYLLHYFTEIAKSEGYEIEFIKHSDYGYYYPQIKTCLTIAAETNLKKINPVKLPK